jgi:hypothetical protein
MALGSFLAGAGRIGQGIRAEEAAMRQARQQQLALEELNRQDEFRRLQLEAPVAEVPAQGLMLGAPMQVAEPALAPAPTTAVAPTPASIPTSKAPSERRAGVQPTGAPAAPTKPTGVTIPGTIKAKGRDRLGDGVAGFERIDPNASDASKLVVTKRNESALGFRLSELGKRTEPWFTGLRTPFLSQTDKQRLELQDRAGEWYQSEKANRYFRQNPELLPAAERDPVGFYQAVLQAGTKGTPTPRYEESRYEGPSVRRAGVQQRLQNFEAALASIPANDPYRRIIGLEGGIDTKTGQFKISPAGAVGPAQLMPKTAPEAMELAGFSRSDKRWKTDPYVNIMAGRAYYNMLLNRFGGDATKAAAAYNAGAGRVDTAVRKAERSGLSWVDHMPSKETREYVRDFLADSGRATRFAEGGAGAPQLAGVNTGTTPTAAPVRIDPSNFYLANTEMVTQDMRVALQNRQELARMADMYRRAGMGDQFTQARLKVLDLDNSMLFLQGMQGISELAFANDPRRIAAVWSQYAGVPIELQPQTDGTYNIMVSGRVTQRGLPSSAIIDTARSAFDAEYRKSRMESNNAIALEQFKSTLRLTEESAKAVLQTAREAQGKLLDGQNQQALEIIKQLDPNGEITALGDGTGRAVLRVQGQTILVDSGGVPIEGTDGLVSGPSAAPIAGLPQRTVGIGTGG